jgi:hypothetical protein
MYIGRLMYIIFAFSSEDARFIMRIFLSLLILTLQ